MEYSRPKQHKAPSLLASIKTSLETKLIPISNNIKNKCTNIKSIAKEIYTGKFEELTAEDISLLTPRSNQSLPSIYTTSSSDESYQMKNPVQKKPGERLFQILPMTNKKIISDYTLELRQYLKAEEYLKQSDWLNAAKGYGISLKIIPKLGHGNARHECMRKRALCFSNIAAEKQQKLDDYERNCELYHENFPMIVGKLRARWLIPLPLPGIPPPIFTPEKLIELQNAYDRISKRETGKPALMWDHKESVLRTVENDGLLLQYVVSWLRKDPEIVMAAVTNNGIALQYADSYLQTNMEICLAAVKQNGWSLQFCTYRGDRELVIEAAKNDSGSIIFANHEFMEDEELLNMIGEGILTYREICLNAVAKDGNALRFIHPDLLRDVEICTVAVTSPTSTLEGYGTALRFCNDEMRNNKQIVMAAVQYDGLSLAHANLKLKKNRKIIIAALDENGAALQFVGGGRGGILQVQIKGIERKKEVEVIQKDAKDPDSDEEEDEETVAALLKKEKIIRAHGIAQYNLGTAYYSGRIGVNKSVRKARHWWELAARCGHPIAQYNLGLMYLNGMGVPSQSFEKSKYHLTNAMMNGHENAKEMLIEVEKQRHLRHGPLKIKNKHSGGGNNTSTDGNDAATSTATTTLLKVKRKIVRPPQLGIYGVGCHPLRNDREFILIAIESNPMALEYASPNLRSDLEICIQACSINGRALQFVSCMQWTEKEKTRILNVAVRSVGHHAVLDVMPDMMVLKEDDIDELLRIH